MHISRFLSVLMWAFLKMLSLQMENEDCECKSRDCLEVNRGETVSTLAGSLEGEQGQDLQM